MRTYVFGNYSDSTKTSALNSLSQYYLTNNLDSAVRYGKIMLDRAKKSKNKRYIARAYAYQGDVAAKTNNYAEQINYLSKALKLMGESNDIEGTIRINTRISGVYIIINDYANAMEHIEKSIELINSQIGSEKDSNLSRANMVLGEIYLKKKEPKKALDCFKLAYEKAEAKKHDDWFTAKTLECIAKSYLNLNDIANAELYYKKALTLNKHLGDISGMTRCKEGFADLFFSKNMPDSAMAQMKGAERLANQQNDKEALLRIYTRYINFYGRQNEYKKQSEYLLLKEKLKDTLNTLTFNRSMADARANLYNEEKEIENALLQEKNKVLELEIKSKRNLAFLLLTVALCILLALLLLNARNKLQSQIKNIELEHQLLRNQMNPHFVFNSLSSIQSFVLTEDSMKAAKYLSIFSKLMRKSLDSSSKEFLSSTEEIETLNLYVEIEKMRFKNEFNFSIDYNHDSLGNMSIPPMLIQPHIENAIRHALVDSETHNSIKVSFHKKEGLLYCKIEDNGIGIEESLAIKQFKKDLHTSTAINLTKARLELLCRKQKLPFVYTIKDKKHLGANETGTIVEFLLPYIYESESTHS